MSVKLLTEHHLAFLSLKGGCTGSSESTLVKIPHCWKSHATAQMNKLIGAEIYAHGPKENFKGLICSLIVVVIFFINSLMPSAHMVIAFDLHTLIFNESILAHDTGFYIFFHTCIML